MPLNEVAAWRLAFAMGDPWRQLVSTAVFRKINEAGGALINDRKAKADLRVFAEAGHQVLAAAFWDALIGQQDRNQQNFRYDRSTRTLALIDHGFTFARPGDVCTSTLFLTSRFPTSPGITAEEQAALEALVANDLYGLRGFVDTERADAVEKRAREMLRTKLLPAPGAF